MGAVQVEVGDPFRHSLIGVAPLIFGSLAVLVIGQGQLNLTGIGQAIISGNLEAIWLAIVQTLALPDVWVWLYLVFAISNAMLPSASDREAWRTVLLYLGLALILAIGLGLNPSLPADFQRVVLTGFTYLLSAFTITIAVDLVFMAFILTFEIFLGRLLGRQVQYNR